MKIEITDQPFNLIALEALCATARQQGFPDSAYVRSDGQWLTLTSDPGALLFEPTDRLGHGVPRRPEEPDEAASQLTSAVSA